MEVSPISYTASLLDLALEKYNEKYCQCSYPRFIQIVSIDCYDYGESFRSFETEVFIEKSRKYFETAKFESKRDSYAEKWVCRKCNSEFEYYWSDLSIALDRATLKPINIKAKAIGAPPVIPIPLYRGLSGYSYPPKSEIRDVSMEEFEKYILEEPNPQWEIPTQRKKLFDGTERDFYDKEYEIDYGNRVIIKAADFEKNLDEIRTEISSRAFEELLRTFKFKSSPFGNRVFYRSKENLNVRYIMKDRIAILTSSGEIQPGRYVFYLEGVWQT